MRVSAVASGCLRQKETQRRCANEAGRFVFAREANPTMMKTSKPTTSNTTPPTTTSSSRGPDHHYYRTITTAAMSINAIDKVNKVKPFLATLSDAAAAKEQKQDALMMLKVELEDFGFSSKRALRQQTKITSILIDAVGAPNHSDQFYELAITSLLLLGLVDPSDKVNFVYDERATLQIVQGGGIEALLTRISDPSWPCVLASKLGLLVLHACLEHGHGPSLTMPARQAMASHAIRAAALNWDRHTQAHEEYHAPVFASSCILIGTAFSHVPVAERYDFATRAISFSTKGCASFPKDPVAQEATRYLGMKLTGLSEANNY